MGRAQVESEIAHLENQTSRLDAESSLRIAILPPLVAIWVYFVLFDSWSWVFAGVFLPSLFAQAYVRITDLEVASQSLFELRRHLGLPPRSAREAEELPVTRVMIPEDDIVSYDVGTSERLEDIPLSAIRDRMRQMDPPSRRMPIRNSAGTVLYVIQASTLTSYAEMQGQTTFTLDKSFGDLLAVPEFKELVEAIGFVPENATVDEARMVMGAIANCENVFVTSNGRRDERAIGWLTTPLLASSTGRGTLGAAGR